MFSETMIRDVDQFERTVTAVAFVPSLLQQNLFWIENSNLPYSDQSILLINPEDDGDINDMNTFATGGATSCSPFKAFETSSVGYNDYPQPDHHSPGTKGRHFGGRLSFP